MPSVIRYHAHCTDGIVSAALAARAFGVRAYAPYHHPNVGSLPEHLPDAIGVDIPLIGGMVEWFDHHATGLKFCTPDVRSRGGQGMRAVVHYDPEAPACATLLPAHPNFAALVHDVACIDRALFSDAASATDLRNPMLLADATIIRLEDDALESTIITTLATTTDDPREQLIRCIPDVELERTRQLFARDVALLTARAVLDREVLTFDATSVEGATICSYYLTFACFPKTRYAVLLLPPRGRRIALSLSVNPWAPPTAHPPKALDAIALRYGGGGHARISGIKFPDTPEGLHAARAAWTSIAAELRA